MSRARLGLYILARVALFQNCFELTPAFNQLTERPEKLYLAPNESYPPKRKGDEDPADEPLIIQDMPHMAKFVYDFYRSKVENLVANRGYMQRTDLRQPPIEKRKSLGETPPAKKIKSGELSTKENEPVKGEEPMMEESSTREAIEEAVTPAGKEEDHEEVKEEFTSSEPVVTTEKPNEGKEQPCEPTSKMEEHPGVDSDSDEEKGGNKS